MTTSAHTIRRAESFLAAAGAVLLLAGCGASKNNDTTGSGQQQPSQNIVADAYRYSACMRSHGVPSFPDPHVVVNTPTKQAIGIHPLPQTIASSPQFKAAQEACKGIMPAPGNGNAKERMEEGRARGQYLLAFAQCLRSHGVQGFPDPTAQGQLTLAMIHAAGVDLQAPSVLTAAQACIGVTHGAITLAQVEQAIHHPAGSESGGGGQGGEGSESSGGGR
jgi:hypothetical protein